MNLLLTIFIVIFPFLVFSETFKDNDAKLFARLNSRLPDSVLAKLSTKAEKVTAVLASLSKEITENDDDLFQLGKSAGNASALEILKKNSNFVSDCYSSTVGKEKNVDIFHLSRGEVAKKYFKYHLDLIEKDDLATIFKRIRALLGSIAYISNRVVECVGEVSKGKGKSSFEPVVIGLTSRSAHSKED